ncbi:unnamed protein product [Parnassius mnemosyne]|uniref:Uncharacterized protein n=1 Tax=Parnassius mnemosyne TaxID=213953 RepID=A0AAV1LTA4_9NEOP
MIVSLVSSSQFIHTEADLENISDAQTRTNNLREPSCSDINVTETIELTNLANDIVDISSTDNEEQFHNVLSENIVDVQTDTENLIAKPLIDAKDVTNLEDNNDDISAIDKKKNTLCGSKCHSSLTCVNK